MKRIEEKLKKLAEIDKEHKIFGLKEYAEFIVE